MRAVAQVPCSWHNGPMPLAASSQASSASRSSSTPPAARSDKAAATRTRSRGRLLTPDAAVALAVAFVSRVAVFAAGYEVVARHHAHAHGTTLQRLVQALAAKDGGSFISIARTGYTRPNSPSFFPGYSLALRAAATLTFGHYAAAGVWLSLLCYAAAMVLLYRLTAAEFDSRTAMLTVAFISVFPVALSFSLVYSESLFLLLTLAAFTFARREHWLLAGLAAMLAVLTRSSGLVLLPALVVLFARQRGWTWRHGWWRGMRDAKFASLLLIPAGLLAYMAYLWQRRGDPLAFSTAERTHWGRSLAWPLVDPVRAYRATVTAIHTISVHTNGLRPLLLPTTWSHPVVVTIFGFATLVLVLGCIVGSWRRLAPELTVYAAGSVLVPLLFPSSLRPLYSFPRLILVAFPLFMVLALATRKRPLLAWILLACSFAGMLWLTRTFVLGIPSI